MRCLWPTCRLVSAGFASTAAGVLALAACSVGDAAPSTSTAFQPGRQPGFIQEPCKDGTTRECSITLGETNGVLSCYRGSQVCQGGSWSACGGSAFANEGVVEQPTPGWYAPDSYRQRSYSVPQDCMDNPCDPNCKSFDEVPKEPLVASGETEDNWQTGAEVDPNAKLNEGLGVPCTSANDCQFNHRCTAVATDSACAHSKCEGGAPLVATCDDCVEQICQVDPRCCQRGWNCAHDVCDIGDRLPITCDDENPEGSCVSAVCAVDSSCCSAGWTSACVALAESECDVECGACGPGEIAAADGSRCYYRNATALSWSAARAACQSRGAGWDLASANSSAENEWLRDQILSDTWLGYNDRAAEGAWEWANGDTVSYANFAFGEPNGGDCVRMLTNGYWYDRDCDYAYDSFCEGPSSTPASSPSWDAGCVDLVQTECHASCGSGDPPSEDGQCVPYRPGVTDPACPEIPELAVGIACEEGIVPVCNHGGVEAPPGVALAYYDDDSGQYPRCSPDPESQKGSCPATTEPIPPGQCVNVQCPTGGDTGLSENDTLVVNPDGGTPECSCLDNWSIYGENVTCGQPSCSGTSSQATFKPVRMFLSIDRSYSMVCHPPEYPAGCMAPGPGCVCTHGRWDGAVSALSTFFADENSAGIGVAMDFFPLVAGPGAGDGCASGATFVPPSASSDAVCASTACANPLVPLGILTDQPSPLDAHEQLLLNTISTAPVSPPNAATAITPSLPALQGALDWAMAHQLASPEETFIVVFVTDGQPSSCLEPGDSFGDTPATDAALVNLSAHAFESTGVRTYTVGIEGANIDVLDRIAAAGGSTEAFVIDGANAPEISNGLASALAEISTQEIECSFPITVAQDLDPSAAQVVYRSETASTTLNRREDAAGCGQGWYYNDVGNPTDVILCPDTCATVQADPVASVQVNVPCSNGSLEPATFTEIYHAACSDGEHSLWQFLTYETTVPEDGTIRFRVRAAKSETDLADSAWIEAGTATQVEPDCLAGAGGPECPVDLADLLAGGAQDEYLELEITVVPSPDAPSPSVDSWHITYSCPPSE